MGIKYISKADLARVNFQEQTEFDGVRNGQPITRTEEVWVRSRDGYVFYRPNSDGLFVPGLDSFHQNPFNISEEFPTTGLTFPRDIFFYQGVAYIGDPNNRKLFAYDALTKNRLESKDRTLTVNPNGMDTDGTTLWVGTWGSSTITAYNFPTMTRDTSEDISNIGTTRVNEITFSENRGGAYLYIMYTVASPADVRIKIYDLSTKRSVDDFSINRGATLRTLQIQGFVVQENGGIIVVGYHKASKIHSLWPLNRSGQPLGKAVSLPESAASAFESAYGAGMAYYEGKLFIVMQKLSSESGTGSVFITDFHIPVGEHYTDRTTSNGLNAGQLESIKVGRTSTDVTSRTSFGNNECKIIINPHSAEPIERVGTLRDRGTGLKLTWTADGDDLVATDGVFTYKYIRHDTSANAIVGNTRNFFEIQAAETAIEPPDKLWFNDEVHSLTAWPSRSGFYYSTASTDGLGGIDFFNNAYINLSSSRTQETGFDSTGWQEHTDYSKTWMHPTYHTRAFGTPMKYITDRFGPPVVSALYYAIMDDCNATQPDDLWYLTEDIGNQNLFQSMNVCGYRTDDFGNAQPGSRITEIAWMKDGNLSHYRLMRTPTNGATASIIRSNYIEVGYEEKTVEPDTTGFVTQRSNALATSGTFDSAWGSPMRAYSGFYGDNSSPLAASIYYAIKGCSATPPTSLKFDVEDRAGALTDFVGGTFCGLTARPWTQQALYDVITDVVWVVDGVTEHYRIKDSFTDADDGFSAEAIMNAYENVALSFTGEVINHFAHDQHHNYEMNYADTGEVTQQIVGFSIYYPGDLPVINDPGYANLGRKQMHPDSNIVAIHRTVNRSGETGTKPLNVYYKAENQEPYVLNQKLPTAEETELAPSITYQFTGRNETFRNFEYVSDLSTWQGTPVIIRAIDLASDEIGYSRSSGPLRRAGGVVTSGRSKLGNNFQSIYMSPRALPNIRRGPFAGYPPRKQLYLDVDINYIHDLREYELIAEVALNVPSTSQPNNYQPFQYVAFPLRLVEHNIPSRLYGHNNINVYRARIPTEIQGLDQVNADPYFAMALKQNTRFALRNINTKEYILGTGPVDTVRVKSQTVRGTGPVNMAITERDDALEISSLGSPPREQEVNVTQVLANNRFHSNMKVKLLRNRPGDRAIPWVNTKYAILANSDTPADVIYEGNLTSQYTLRFYNPTPVLNDDTNAFELHTYWSVFTPVTTTRPVSLIVGDDTYNLSTRPNKTGFSTENLPLSDLNRSSLRRLRVNILLSNGTYVFPPAVLEEIPIK